MPKNAYVYIRLLLGKRNSTLLLFREDKVRFLRVTAVAAPPLQPSAAHLEAVQTTPSFQRGLLEKDACCALH